MFDPFWYWHRLYAQDCCFRQWSFKLQMITTSSNMTLHHTTLYSTVQTSVHLCILVCFQISVLHLRNQLTDYLTDSIWFVVEQLIDRPVGSMFRLELTGWITQPSSCSHAIFDPQRETGCWGILCRLPHTHRLLCRVLWLLVSTVSGDMNNVK